MVITRGTPVQVKTARGDLLPRRALGEIERGDDFPVVWVCREEEWDAALIEDREPQGVPWPAEDVTPDGPPSELAHPRTGQNGGDGAVARSR